MSKTHKDRADEPISENEFRALLVGAHIDAVERDELVRRFSSSVAQNEKRGYAEGYKIGVAQALTNVLNISGAKLFQFRNVPDASAAELLNTLLTRAMQNMKFSMIGESAATGNMVFHVETSSARAELTQDGRVI